MGNNVSAELNKEIQNYKKDKTTGRVRKSFSSNSCSVEEDPKNKTRNNYFNAIQSVKHHNTEKKNSLKMDRSMLIDPNFDINSCLTDNNRSTLSTPRKRNIKSMLMTPEIQNRLGSYNLSEAEMQKNLNETDMFEFDDDMSTNESFRNNKSILTYQSVENNNSVNYENKYDFNVVLQSEKIRKSYISKLLLKDVLTLSQKHKTFNSLIIFDWDDTLFPTTCFNPNSLVDDRILTEKEKATFADLENTVCKLISLATSKADTYIITNAQKSWIYYSAKKFYPDKAERILEKVNIISARGEYEKLFPGDTSKWKLNAFLDTSKNLSKKLLTNIISIGDSLIEITSANKLGETFNNAYIKTLKLKESPKPEELVQQLNLILKQFDMIYCAQKNLNIKLGQKKK